jgi:hypothetical protein
MRRRKRSRRRNPNLLDTSLTSIIEFSMRGIDPTGESDDSFGVCGTNFSL